MSSELGRTASGKEKAYAGNSALIATVEAPVTGDSPHALGESLLNRMKSQAKAQGLTIRYRGFSRPRGEVVYSTAHEDGRDPQPMKAEVFKLAAARGWSLHLKVGDIVSRWEEIVGSDIAQHCEVETYEDGVLVLRTDSHAWAQQLKILSPQLITRITEELGSGAVVELSVKSPSGKSFQRGRRRVQGRGPRDTFN